MLSNQNNFLTQDASLLLRNVDQKTHIPYELQIVFDEKIKGLIDVIPHLSAFCSRTDDGFIRYFLSWCHKMNVDIDMYGKRFDIKCLQHNDGLQMFFLILIQYYFGY